MCCRFVLSLRHFQTANTGIDLSKARREQETLCDALREAGVDVIELAPEDSAPASSIFAEDVAIVCNGTALITRPSHAARKKEVRQWGDVR